MKYSTITLAITAAIFTPALQAEDTTPAELPAMVVSADFRPGEAQDTPVSLTTFDDEIIESRGAQHVEDVLNLAPNVNISSGASRGQYFQIRGIGERSQFAAPLNPSVGLVIDGIDFSRTGGAATLFDIEQVEVLRGPQGTLYGTNGLAGTINLRSKQASEEFDMHFESTLATYNTRAVGVAVGGPLIENSLLGRIAVHTHQSDGYMDNDFLGRDNTHNRDEITARGHLKWLVNHDLTVDLNLLHLNIDNGYDAFTLDNSRNSLADDPGEDSQHTNAFALKADWRASDKVQLQSTVTYAKSDIVYSYDADWGFAGQFDPALFPYIGFEEFKRNRENYSLELRVLSNENGRIFNNSTDWTVGFYHLDQSEKFQQDSDFGIFGATFVRGDYDTQNTAGFGQLDTHLTDKLTLITGLRLEYFDAAYRDSNNLKVDPDEWLFGGKLGLNYQVTDDHLAFTTLSRGYKSGGVNNDARLAPGQREFDTEYLWNLEAGLKSSWLNGDLITNIVAFYALRKDAQVKSSIDIGPQFIDFIDNAAKGKNIGIEADMDWLLNNEWRMFAAVGLLHATFDEFDNPDLEAEGVDLSGRRQAHAPAYNFNLGAEYYFAPNWTLRANMEGKDEFYFSNSHNAKSHSYVLYNASLEYRQKDWKFTLWGRNLFDKNYYTRGFFFGNDPSLGYAERTYVQFGDPRVIGLTVSYDY
ncbi:TonB-dependent receptor [Methylophaga sp. OBS4]|uniref:TonB-dependent receptor n=1 Tax=Methylophaga sp. OBS4 TaxID=2991935 RepID=UPI0022528363|nr:TonB-dependent receptor [Methylophaga sp. OBS4]MCX4187266.1 TonB-dependent receptor [Methylophaga sp. OBS4]